MKIEKLQRWFFLLLLSCCVSVASVEAQDWTQLGSDIEGVAEHDWLGWATSISSDGSRVAVGARFDNENGASAGQVRIYEETNGVWTQIGGNINGDAAGDQSGESVSMSSDGSRVVIGAPRNDGNGGDSGQARVYEETNGVWTQVGSSIYGLPIDRVGYSVSMSSDGSRIAVSASRNGQNGAAAGQVRMYEETNGEWSQIGSSISGESSGDQFGSSVSISSNGSRVAIGAPYDDANGSDAGHVRIFEETNGVWSQIGSDIDGEGSIDRSGLSVSISSDGSIVAIGSYFNDGNGSDAGQVRIYEETNGAWSQVGSDIDGEAAGDQSGISVSISSDGSIVAIGAPLNDGNGSDAGQARIYEETNGVWSQISSDIDGGTAGDGLGYSVSLSSDGNRLATGAPLNNTRTGQVRIYEALIPVGAFTVTNTDDSGAGSLRQAILDANATANTAGGADVIDFTIAGTLTPASALPNITESVTIAGTTAPGYAAGAPTFEIDYTSGFNITGADVTVDGIAGTITNTGNFVQTTAQSGTTTIENCNVIGGKIYALGAQDLIVKNNSFADGINHGGYPMFALNGLTSIDWSDNQYSNSWYGFKLDNMDGLLIGDENVTGADIVLESTSGFGTSYSGVPFNLSNSTNTTVDGIDATVGNTGNFVSTTAQSGTTTIENCNVIGGRITASGAQNLIVKNNSFADGINHGGYPMFALNGLTSIDWSDNQYSNSWYGFKLDNMDGLLIGDENVTGADIVLESTSGFGTSYSGVPFNLSNSTNTTVDEIDATVGNTGNFVQTTAQSGTTTIENCNVIGGKIYALGAQDLIVKNNSFADGINHGGYPMFALNGLTSIDWSDNQYSNSWYGFKLDNMDGLLIGDENVTGADIVLESTSGFGTSYSGVPFNLSNSTNTTVDGIDATVGNTGNFVQTTAQSGTTRIENCNVIGGKIYALGAQDLIVKNNSFADGINHGGYPMFALNGLTSIDWSDNQYSNSWYGFKLDNMDGLLIGDENVTGADIVLESTSGFGTSYSGVPFNLSNSTNTTVDGIDATVGNTSNFVQTTAQSGTTTIENCNVIGGKIYALGAQDLVVKNNSFADGINHGGYPMFALNGLTSIDWSDNQYSNSWYGFKLDNMDGLLIGDENVTGANIVLESTSGFGTSYSGLPIINSTTNLTIDGVDLSGTGGTAIHNTGADFTFQNLVIDGRAIGIQSSAIGTNTISCSSFTNLTDAIDLTAAATATVTNNTFKCLSGFAVDNNGSESINAQGNFFGDETNDGTVDASSPLTEAAACTPAAPIAEITVDDVDNTDLGAPLAGTTSSITYTITNDGGGDLDLNTISSNNSSFTIDNYTATTLAPGETATFDVVFSPTTFGEQTGTISISNSDCDEPNYQFMVSGIGACVAIDDVAITDEVCPEAMDGTLTVTASCPTCANGISDIEYSVDGTNFQASSVFEGLSSGEYTIYAQNVSDNSCAITTEATVAAGTDAVNPTITCGSDLTVVANEECEILMPDLTGDVSTADDCDASPAITQSVEAGTALDYGTVTPVTMTTTDASGNAATCTVNVTVDAAIAPTFTACPTQLQPSLNFGAPNADASFDILTDLELQDYDCITEATVDLGLGDGAVAITDVSDAQFSSGTYPIGVSTVSYSITTIAGNATCTFEVFVVDPICNMEITNVEASMGTCDGATSGELTVTAVCYSCAGGANDLEYSIGGAFQESNVFSNLPAGSPTVTVRKIGDASCNDSQMATITSDTEAPVVTCPAAQEIASDDKCEALITDLTTLTTATDDCTVTITQDIAAGTTYSEATTVTMTATDDSGNSADCTVEFTVVDNTAPTFTCETAVNVTLATGGLTLTAEDLLIGSITDNCDDAPSVSISPADFDCADAGTTVDVTMTVTDASGNSADCTVSVSPMSDAVLAITCPEAQVIASDASCSGLVPDLTGMTSASDDCTGGITISQDIAAGTALTSGVVTTVTMTATNGGGTMVSCTVDVSIEDVDAPVIACPADMNLNTIEGNCNGFAVLLNPTATDNCSAVTVSAPTLDTGATLFEFSNVYLGMLDQGTHVATFTATDDAGNEATCSYSITITDNEAPTFISCPTEVVVESEEEECGNVVQWQNVFANDNCSFAMTSTYLSGDEFEMGSTPVTYTATDDAGNTTDCTFNVVIIDTTAPIAVCQDVTVELSAAGTYTLAGADLNNESTDNCTDAADLTFTSSLTNITCPYAFYPQTVTLTVADASGNEATCTSVVTVIDNIAPVAMCQDYTAVLDADGNATVEATDLDGGSTDNCNISLEITDGATAYDCSNTGMDYELEVTVTDASGNSATCTATVSVVDTENPTIICPVNITQTNDATLCSAVVSWDAPVIADNCIGSVATSTANSGDVFPVGTTDVDYTVTDASGNTATCTFSVTVTDDEAPAAVCQDVTVELNAAGMASITPADVNNGSNDNCTDAANLILALDEMDFGCLNAGSGAANNHSLYFNGNNSTILENVNSTDNFTLEAWFKAEPASGFRNILGWQSFSPTKSTLIAINNSGGIRLGQFYYGSPAAFEEVNASGNYEDNQWHHLAVSKEGTSLKLYLDGSLAETLVINANNLSSTGLTELRIGNMKRHNGTLGEFFKGSIDEVRVWSNARTEAEIAANMNTTLTGAQANLIAYYPFEDGTGSATATDESNNGYDATLTNINVNSDWLSGATPLVGSMNEPTVTLTVTDEIGNSSTCTSTITVEDNIAPMITACPADQTVSNDAGECSAIVSWTEPTASDNCSIDFISSTHNSGDTFENGTTAVTYTAVDPSGNEVTCSFNVTIEDTEAPVITCPADIAQDNDAGVCGAAITWDELVSTDNCPEATVESTHNSGDVFPIGTTEVGYTITDAAGNAVSCAFNVVISDTEAPVIAGCPENITQDNDTDACDAAVMWTAPTATDNCSQTLTSTHNSGDTFAVGTTTVTYTSVDEAGNDATCSFDVTVVDAQEPVIVCNEDIVQDTDAGSCDAVVTYDAPVGTDNCEGATTTLIGGLASGSTFPLGSTDVTYSVTDAAGNAVSCTFSITVEDNEAPVIAGCPADMTQANDVGMCNALVNWTAPTTSDNCSADLTSTHNSGDTFENGTTAVTYTAVDPSGNEVTCSFNVTIEDTEAPVIACPSDVLQDTDTDECSAVVEWDAPVSSDNCPETTIESTHASGDTFPLGSTEVGYTITDAAGNVTTCAFNVVIEDNQAPNAICQDVTVQLDENGAVTITAEEVNNESTDACGVDTAVLDITSFDCSNLGSENTVTLTVTDVNGNPATCDATITVEDNIAPVITDCPADITGVSLSTGCSGSATWTIPTFADNCSFESEFDSSDVPVITVSTTAFGTFPGGVTPITYTVTDGSGNETICTFNVTIEDNLAPTITGCPSDMTVNTEANSCEAQVFWLAPTVSDNCPGTVVEATHNPGETFPTGTTNVGYTVTDAAGNVATCEFSITVSDTEKPQLSCPLDDVMAAGDGNCGYTIPDLSAMVTATDNCTASPIITQSPAIGDAVTAETFVTYIATDEVGNATACQVDIIIPDDLAASISAMFASCPSSEDGEVSVIVTGGTEPYTYSWTGSDATTATITGVTAGTYTVDVTDANGCTVSEMIEVTGTDTTNPVADCENITVTLGEDGTATIEAAQLNDDSSDDCGIASITASQTEFDCTQTGQNAVTVTVTDGSGNTDECTATVTVEDSGLNTPVFCGETFTVQVDENGNASVQASDFGTVEDNCGSATAAVLGSSSFDCEDIGTTSNVTVIIFDNNNNFITCLVSVEVEDAIAPTAMCENLAVSLDDDGNASIDANAVGSNSTDNCDGLTLALDQTDFTCADIGTQSVTLTVTDASGNSSTCTASIDIVDDSVPIPDFCGTVVTLELDENGSAELDAAALGGVSDNCGSASVFFFGNTIFDCDDIAVTSNVSVLVIDNLNNVSFCVVPVTVSDPVPATAVCQDFSLALDDNGNATLLAEDIGSGSIDNCGNLVMSLDITEFTCADIGDHTVTLTVSDAAGNSSSTCTATVSVVDDTVPNPTFCGNTVVLDLDSNGEAVLLASELGEVTDNCNNTVSIFMIGKTEYGCDDLDMTTNITVIVMDGVGSNIANCIVTIDVEDPLNACVPVPTVAPIVGDDTETASERSDATENTLDENNGDVRLTGVSAAPNPFAYQTKISYELNVPAEVRISVLDARGQLVTVLTNSVKSSGTHRTYWRPEGNVVSGLYFILLETEGNEPKFVKVNYAQ